LAGLIQTAADSLNVSRFLAERDPLGLLAEELGPVFSLYRQKWDLARNFKIELPFPLHVDYELLQKCNLRCPMCLYGLSRPDKDELDPKTVSELMREGAEAGQMAMGFGGLWEPLLSPHLPDIIAQGRSLGLIDVMFNTNGLLLTREKSRDLIESGLTRLMISVDAAAEETYRLMRPGGDFRLLESNILEFLALRREMGRRLPVLRLSFCVTRLNQAELVPFLDKWSGRADFFSVQKYGRFSPSLDALFSKTYLYQPSYSRCAQPSKRLLVRHSGEVIACCDLSGLSLTAGRISQSSLAEIWQGPFIRNLRAAMAQNCRKWPQACRDCQTKYS
jgi:radical SAM protein with 4Fe4S-binding SPASM domain